MKKFRALALVAAFFAATLPAAAQWQVPAQSVPIGRGGGAVGFDSVPPGVSGFVWTSNGPGVRPSYQSLPPFGTVTSITLQGGVKGSSNPITNNGIITADPNYDGFATQNCTITASVGSNVLTVALKDNAGSDPTAASPCNVNYRNATISNGSTASVQQTSALSISTFAAGATLGSSNSTPFRFWVVVFNNGGTNVLALINCSTATAIFPLNEGNIATSVAMNASATSAGVFYTPNGTTVSAKAFRILGYVEYGGGLATAGTYISLPTAIQAFGAGIKKPGDIVQTAYASSNTAVQNSNTYTPSATLPTTANGVLAVSAPSFTASATPNLVRVRGTAIGSLVTATAATFVGYLASGTTVVGAASVVGSSAPTALFAVPLNYQALVPSTGGNPSAVVFSIYVIGSGASSSNAINQGTAALWTGATVSNITVEEIMGALPEPANDNINPGVMSRVG